MKKNKPLLPELVNYMDVLDELSDDEISLSVNLLDCDEKIRLKRYENTIGENINRKRLFIFLCSLVDFKETNKLKNEGS